MECAVCHKELKGGLDTYGELQKPLCWSDFIVPKEPLATADGNTIEDLEERLEEIEDELLTLEGEKMEIENEIFQLEKQQKTEVKQLSAWAGPKLEGMV